MNPTVPYAFVTFNRTAERRRRLGPGYIGMVGRPGDKTIVFIIMKTIILTVRTAMRGLGCVRAGRKKTPETLATHALRQEENTRKADADDGNSGLGAQPKDGCSDFV